MSNGNPAKTSCLPAESSSASHQVFRQMALVQTDFHSPSQSRPPSLHPLSAGSKSGARRGFTLVEIVMAVLLGSLLFLVLTRLLSGGVRITQKGSSHLTNAQAAAILLGQVESDLGLALTLETPAGSGPVEEFKIQAAISSSNAALPQQSLIVYQPAPASLGVDRRQGDTEPHRFCAGLHTRLTLRRVSVPASGHQGCLVEVRVKTPPQGTEEAVFSRFIPCPNLPANREAATPGWTF